MRCEHIGLLSKVSENTDGKADNVFVFRSLKHCATAATAGKDARMTRSFLQILPTYKSGVVEVTSTTVCAECLSLHNITSASTTRFKVGISRPILVVGSVLMQSWQLGSIGWGCTEPVV